MSCNASLSQASRIDHICSGSYNDEDEAPPQLDDDLNFDDFIPDLPPPVQQGPPQQPKPPRPQRPTISIEGPQAPNAWNDHIPNQSNTSYEAAPDRVMESPVLYVFSTDFAYVYLLLLFC